MSQVKPGEGYDPPLPPLPEGPDAITPATKLILELYAQEIREHASGIQDIVGLDPAATYLYKRYCFNAANDLDSAASILRRHNLIADIKMVRVEAHRPPRLVGEKKVFWLWKRIFGRALPSLLGFCGLVWAVRHFLAG